MKKKQLGNITFRPLALSKIIKPEEFRFLNCPSSRSETSTADPFENLKISDKNYPSLRPILNKHRKTPSLSFIPLKDFSVNDKSSSNSMKISKSESILPKVFQVNLIKKKCITKANLPPICMKEPRAIHTPFFKPEISNRPECQKDDFNLRTNKKVKRNHRVRFFDHIQNKKIQEISFGDIRDNFNSVVFKTNN